jgi:hypothetical protein
VYFLQKSTNLFIIFNKVHEIYKVIKITNMSLNHLVMTTSTRASQWYAAILTSPLLKPAKLIVVELVIIDR